MVGIEIGIGIGIREDDTPSIPPLACIDNGRVMGEGGAFHTHWCSHEGTIPNNQINR
jgi:hypothetical protein